jgi:hypothetical protein
MSFLFDNTLNYPYLFINRKLYFPLSLAQLMYICIIMQGNGVRTSDIPLIHLKDEFSYFFWYIRMNFQIIRLLDKKKSPS